MKNVRKLMRPVLAFGVPIVVLAGTLLAISATQAVPGLLERSDRINLNKPGWGNSRTGQYLAGRSAELRKDPATAAHYLELALGHNPADTALRRHVFYLMVAEGQLTNARQHARALLRTEQNAFLPLMTLAVLTMQDGNYEEAISLFGQLNGGGHDGIMRALGQAWAAVGANDLAAAQAILNFPMDAPGWQGLKTVHQAMVEDLGGGDATAAFDALKTEPGRKSTRLQAIIHNFDERQADPATAPLIENAGQGMAQAFGSVAAALFQARQAVTGTVYVQLGLALSPHDDSLLLLLADAYRENDRNADAAAAYDRILPQSGYYYTAQIARAQNLAAADQLDAGIALLHAITAQFPDRSDAPASLGDMLRREQRFQEAAAAYDMAFARIPDGGQANWQLHYTRGVARERLGEWSAAEADFTTALAMANDQPLVLNYLGYSWIDRGEHLERATEMVRKAAELRPEDGFIADSVGWAAYRTGDMTEAVRELERAILIEPLDPTINEHLGDVYWVVGRKIEARYQWERALAFEPEEERISGLKERLNCDGEQCAPLAEDRMPVAQ